MDGLPNNYVIDIFLGGLIVQYLAIIMIEHLSYSRGVHSALGLLSYSLIIWNLVCSLLSDRVSWLFLYVYDLFGLMVLWLQPLLWSLVLLVFLSPTWLVVYSLFTSCFYACLSLRWWVRRTQILDLYGLLQGFSILWFSWRLFVAIISFTHLRSCCCLSLLSLSVG